MDLLFEEFIDELSDSNRAEKGDPIMDTAHNFFELLDLALMELQYELYMYEGILEFGCKWEDSGDISAFENEPSYHENFLKRLCDGLGEKEIRVRLKQIIKKICLPGYEASDTAVGIALEAWAMRICFWYIGYHRQRDKNINQQVVTRLSLSAAKLLYVCGGLVGSGASLASNRVRIDKSAKTNEKNADVAYNKVVEVCRDLKITVPRWEKKSDSQKADRIQEELNKKMGIGKDEKPYRAANTIRKVDLPRAKREGLI